MSQEKVDAFLESLYEVEVKDTVDLHSTLMGNHHERIDTLEGLILRLQAEMSNNFITWEHEKRVYENMVFDLQKRVDTLEKAPQQRSNEISKLWDWVRALEQRLIRAERHEQPGGSRQPAQTRHHRARSAAG